MSSRTLISNVKQRIFRYSFLQDLKTPLKTENYENYHNINSCTSEFTFILFVLLYRLSSLFSTPKLFYL